VARTRTPQVTTSSLLAVLAVLLLGVASQAASRGGATGRDWWSRWSAAELERDVAGEVAAAGAGWLARPLQILLAVALVGLTLLLARRLLTLLALRRMAARERGQPGLLGGRLRYAAGDTDHAAYADALADAALLGAGSLHTALASGAPGAVSDAVIESWVLLESVAADAGAIRRSPDTAAEFADGLLARRMVGPDALGALSELYSRARFSDEQLDAADGRRASAALSALRGDLLEAAR